MKKIVKKCFKSGKSLVLSTVTCSALLVNNVTASEVTILNVFIDGQAAVAGQVNDNFTAMQNAVNDNFSEIDSLQIKTNSNEGSILDHETRLAEQENRSKFVSIAPEAFRDEGDTVNPCKWVVKASEVSAYWDPTSDAECDAVASIHLPHGANFKALKCMVNHSNIVPFADSVFFSLFRVNLDSFVRQTIFLTPPSINTGFQQLADSTPNTAGLTVDNSQYVYRMKSTFTDAQHGSEVTFSGCIVELD